MPELKTEGFCWHEPYLRKIDINMNEILTALNFVVRVNIKLSITIATQAFLFCIPSSSRHHITNSAIVKPNHQKHTPKPTLEPRFPHGLSVSQHLSINNVQNWECEQANTKSDNLKRLTPRPQPISDIRNQHSPTTHGYTDRRVPPH